MSRPNQTSTTTATAMRMTGAQTAHRMPSWRMGEPGSGIGCDVVMAGRSLRSARRPPARQGLARLRRWPRAPEGGHRMDLTETPYAADLDAEEQGWYEIATLVRRCLPQ